MFINNLNEYNQITGRNTSSFDVFKLRQANRQVNEFIAGHTFNSPYAIAYQEKLSVNAEIQDDKVILDKAYRKGAFDFTTAVILNDEYDVKNTTIENDKTVLYLFEKLTNQSNIPVLIFQKWQAPFRADVQVVDGGYVKSIRKEIKEAVALQYDYILKKKFDNLNKQSESLSGSNYSVSFGKSTSLHDMINPEARGILTKYKPYLM